MLKAIQCESCGFAMTVTKLAEMQQVACPQCQLVIAIPPTAVDKNTIIGNRYQIKERFEENPQASLYMAVDLETEEYSLVRVYSWAFSSAISNIDDFLHTIASVSHLAEPAHIGLTDYGYDDGYIFTVSAYEDMESIEEIVKRNGPISPAMAVSICKDLALSLDKAYHSAGIGHFSLSPDCIFVNSQGSVRYCDFGLSAHLSNDAAFMQSGFSLWNMNYLSPEMAMGWSYPDLKSDMYALASVLYFMVTGYEPHAGARSVQEINYDSLQFPDKMTRDLGRVFQDFFYSMTARNPAQRYMSWSQAVSKMDEFLYEQKSSKNSGTSQRQRASLTKLHKADQFDNIPVPSPKKKKVSKGSQSQKRMSAEDVRRKFSSKSEAAPMSFAKGATPPPSASGGHRKSSASGIHRKSGTGSFRKASSSGPNRKASSGSYRKPSATGAHRKSSATGAHRKSSATGAHRKSSATGAYRKSSGGTASRKNQAASPPESKKTNAVLLVLGIVFGLMVIGFLVMAALGGNKKPVLAEDGKPEKVEEEDSKIDKSQFKPFDKPDKKEVVDVPDKKETEPDKPDKKEVVDVPDKKETEPDKPVPADSKLKTLIAKIKDDLNDRDSDSYRIETNLIEARKLAEGNEAASSQLAQLTSNFTPRRQLAVRMALTDVVQEVRNLQLRRKYDEALAKCDNYNGPFASDLKDDLQRLKEKVEKSKTAPGKPVVVAKPDPDKKEMIEEAKTVTDENVKLEDFVERISKAQSSVALVLFPKVEKKFGLQIENLPILKALLEKSTPESIQKMIAAYFESMITKDINVTIKNQKMTGKLQAVDKERGTMRVAVDFNGRELVRVLKLEDVEPLDLIDNLPIEDESEKSFLKVFLNVRASNTVDALKSLVAYTGPLKAEIEKQLRKEMDQVAVGELMNVLSLLALPSIDDKNFEAMLTAANANREDGWLAQYMLNRFKVDYSETEFFKKNVAKLELLSRKLSRLAQGAKSPTVIVSDDGTAGTKNLESALREAKSGAIIRMLPGMYSGTLEIRQRGVKLYGASGVFIDAPLRVSKKSIEIKQIGFTNGNLELTNEASSIDIINCKFTKDGIDLQGDNNEILIKNCLIYGITARSNKRVELQDCTIFERAQNGGKQNYFCIRGFINGNFTNCLIFAENNFILRFNEKDKSNAAFKYCMLYSGNSLALIDNTTRISDLKEFKKEVGRTTSVTIMKPEFNDEAKGDFRLKDFTPGFLAGENKKSIGVQMGADLKLLDVK